MEYNNTMTKEGVKKMIILQGDDKERMEVALTYLMNQFRHIEAKYDLMVREEIEARYEKRNQSIVHYEEKLDRLTIRN